MLLSACCLPAQAADWCEVPPARAAPFVPSVIGPLQAARDRPPQPLPTVHTEGTLPHQGMYDASMAAKRDLPLMRDAALAWRAGAGEAWLHFATRYLMAWVGVYRPSLDPIDETGFEALIDTYAIVGARLPPDEREQVRRYLHDWAWGYVGAIRHGQAAHGRADNWQSHRIKLATMMAVALHDDELFRTARSLFQAQIAANIAPDGETVDFRVRDALHYVVYDLQPLVQAALAAHSLGEDWYRWRAPGGASLAGALAWLAPYAAGEKTHEEFVHSQVKFDAMRARAGLKGFTGPFDPRAAAALYWLAAELDPSVQPLARKLGDAPPSFVRMCGQ
ncbi:alginate lyase family protein [Frateuria defendens]|uniref:alginate lyase family protein n=1 Tax=Frateuria defendens TaxID=2219559 RepID=UPI0007DC1AD4|nr:alginate lyase family protein [Frateuria defendens]